MLSQLPSSHHRENEKFAGYEAAEAGGPLWRADWGIKQWIPYLVGKSALVVKRAHVLKRPLVLLPIICYSVCEGLMCEPVI
jgi:hypothetical protein